MRSIERRFRRISQKNQYLSSLTCFRKAIEGQKFKKRTLYFWFNKLVDKTDYNHKDKRVIMQGLENLKPP